MDGLPPEPCAEGSRPLAEFVADVRVARQAVHARRMVPVVWTELLDAQRLLLRALEAYASELTARHLPIPYRLRDALRVQRAFGPPSARTRGAGPYRRSAPEADGRLSVDE